MSIKPERTRLSPVYLTSTERDLVIQAFDVLLGMLTPEFESHFNHTRQTKFARSYTSRRIKDTQALFADKKQEASQ